MKIGSDQYREQKLRKRVAALALVAVAVLFAEPLLITESTPVAPITEQR